MMMLFLLITTYSSAQQISLLSLSTKDYPKVSATFVAKDANGNRATPNSSDIKIFENNIQIPISNYVCPQPPPTLKPVSIVITLDNSGSMLNSTNGESNMEVAKKAALKLVDELPNSNIEVAITSFDGSSLLRQDFTNDKTLLAAAINSIQPNGSTNYDAGLITPPAGALEITKKARYAKNIIFLTDGISTTISEQAIINEAQNQQCKIHVVCVRLESPKELISIANATNGFLYEKVKNISEAAFIFTTILDVALGRELCTIEWNSTIVCNTSLNKVMLQWNQAFDSTTYIPPIFIQPNLAFTPVIAELEFKGIGVATTKIVSVTNNYNVPIQISTIVSSNPNFTVTPSSFSLQVGQTIDLTVSTTSTDSSYQYTTFTLSTNQCNQEFYAGSNRFSLSPKLPLTLVKPNGGEVFVAGIDTVIRWKNISPKDTVSLYYSLDNGKKWNTITHRASGLEYKWQIPNQNSDSCLVKVEFSVRPKRDRDSNNVSLYHPTGYISDATWDLTGQYIYYRDFGSKFIKKLDTENDILVDSFFINNYVAGLVKQNPTSNLLAIGSDFVLIFNLDTKSVVEQITLPPNNLFNPRLWDLQWSPNGKFLAMGFREDKNNDNNPKNYLAIYDITTKAFTYTLEKNHPVNNYLLGLTWHPNSSLLAVSSLDKEISIIDISTGVTTTELQKDTSISRNKIAWSPDGTQIITACGINNTRTYRNSENVLYTIQNSSVAGSIIIPACSDIVNYNPVNNTIAIDSAGKAFILHDKLLKPLQILLPPNYVPLDPLAWSRYTYANLQFSPDGTRLMGATRTNFGSTRGIIIWEIDDTNSQVDVSDSVFRIVVPEFKTQAIDMGKVLVGSAKDSVITPFIENTSEAPFAVNTIRIIGPDQSAFSLVSGTPVYTISAFSSSFGEFQFVPNRVGIHNAFVEVITQADSVVIPIQGEGIQDAIAHATKIIDFGTIDVFTKKDSLNVTTISAVSATPIQVTNARIEGGSASSFAILSPFAGNTTITSTDTLKLDLQFFAQSVGRVQSQLILDHTRVGSPSVITLFGNGRDTAIGNLRIVAPELTAKTNTFLKIPIYLENVDNGTFSSNAIVDFNLRFNQTILTPRTANAQSTIANGERSVPLSFPLQPDANGVIGTIEMRVGLGDASSTPLFIDSVRVRNSPERIGKRDGLVTIIDICEEGGTRLVNSSTKVGLALMSANPVSNQFELKLTSAELGNTIIQLFDAEGKLVSELWNGSPIIGDTYLTVRATNYPNGIYFLLLKTPTVQETIPFIIQR
jgi:hypothetical protein